MSVPEPEPSNPIFLDDSRLGPLVFSAVVLGITVAGVVAAFTYGFVRAWLGVVISIMAVLAVSMLFWLLEAKFWPRKQPPFTGDN